MKNFKTYAFFAALLAGTMTLPIADAKAEGYKSSDKTSATTTTSSGQTFKSLDSDKSGSLSESEFNAYSNTSVGFDDADANGDGKLTLSELQNVPTASPSTKQAPMEN